MPKDDALGGASAEKHRHLVLQLLARHQEAVLGRSLNRVAERADAAWNDRDLVHRIAARQRKRDERVPHLVVRDDLAFLRIEQAIALLEAGDHALDRLVEIRHRDLVGAATGGEQRRLVDEVREIGAGEARRERGDLFELDVGRQLGLLEMDPQDLDAPLLVRAVDQDLAVEAAGAQQRRVEDLRPVGRREDDEAGAGIEAVHLDQQLIERLLLLVVTAGIRADAAGAAERVELVDEDDAGRLRACLLEKIAHARGADADEHLDELGAARSRRTAPPPRRRPPARAASCRCRAARRAARPSACARRGGRTARVSSESRRSRAARPSPRRRRRRRRSARRCRSRRRSSPCSCRSTSSRRPGPRMRRARKVHRPKNSTTGTIHESKSWTSVLSAFTVVGDAVFLQLLGELRIDRAWSRTGLLPFGSGSLSFPWM